MLNNLKTYLEKIHMTPISWLIGVSGVLMVRFFLESISSPTSSGFFASDASTLVHYYLFFMLVFVIFMILFQYSIPSWKNISTQFVAITSLIIFVAPIIDWIVSEGKGFRMTYFFDAPKNVAIRFLTFGVTDIYTGATIGLRIEIALVLLFFGLLVFFVQKSLIRAIVSSLALYITIIILVSLPSIISIIVQSGHFIQNNPIIFFQNSIINSSTISNNLHNSLQYSSMTRLFEISFNFMIGKVLFLIFVFTASFWFYMNFKEKFKAIIRNSRVERVAHYMFMIFLGIFVVYSFFPSIKLNWNDWLSVIVLCLAFYFSWVFAVCTNDMVDEDIDAVSNANRPLITNALNREDLKQTAAIFLTLSLLSAFLAGYTAFFFVLTFTALYYIYSVPPTRFKIIPFFSSFIISLCSLTAVMAGFFLLSPLKYVSAFPVRLILAVVVIFFLGSHIRDMKDIEGDKKAGIKTVPVIFGDIWGPRAVGIFAGLAFLLVPIFSKIYILFIAAIPASIAVFHFINRKPYKEKFIFRTYFIFVFVSFVLLLV